MDILVQIPGSVDTHRKLMGELFLDLENSNEFHWFIPSSLTPEVGLLSGSSEISWRICFWFDEKCEHDWYRVSGMARRDRVRAYKSKQLKNLVLIWSDFLMVSILWKEGKRNLSVFNTPGLSGDGFSFFALRKAGSL